MKGEPFLSKWYSPFFLPDGYAKLMRPNKAETAVHSCHSPGDIAVRMRKALARSWAGVRVCHLLLLFLCKRKGLDLDPSCVDLYFVECPPWVWHANFPHERLISVTLLIL